MFFQGQGTTGVAINSQYNNWQTGEPNNSGGNEDYAYMASTQYWVDAPTTGTMYKYVVEYGGTGFGGNLDLSISATDIQNFKNKVTYSNSAIADTASVTINGLNITSAPTDRNATLLATALETAINDQINSGALKNVEVVRQGSKLSINSTVAGTPFQLTSVSTSNTANTISASEITGNQVATSSTDNLNAKSNFSHLGFYEGTFGGLVNEATSKISPPRTGRMTFQIGANEGNKITIDLADFGKAGPITGDITWDADMDPLAYGAEIPSAQSGGPQIQGKPLTRNFIGSRSAAQEVLKKLDLVADKINQTRASLGAVMNRLDHVINNLTNFSMNLSASRSQIADADYAAASTDMAKFQIKQQAATAVLAQANTISQKSVIKLLQG
jgi:flagellin